MRPIILGKAVTKLYTFPRELAYSRGMRVLVVEDDPILAHGLTETLRREGFVTDNVPSAEGADAALKVTNVELVILDIGLPGLERFTCLKRLPSRGAEQ